MSENRPHLPYSFAKQHGVLLDLYDENHAEVLHTGSLSPTTILELRRVLQRPLKLTTVDVEEFQNRLTLAYESSSGAAAQMVAGIEEEMNLDELMEKMPLTEDLLESQDDAPVIRLLNALLSQAIKQKSSDIHLEPFADGLKIRFRVDGVLQEVLTIQRAISPLIISRVKVMAKLDIAEKRIPQDGRITLRIAGHSIDVRVSTMPANHGERVVLRLLDKKQARLDLGLLGMHPNTLKRARELISHPHGIILVTGPTGSGKTTSLYAMLTELNESTRNILTIEDPIEYDLMGIGQTQVNTKVDMTFARGLRAILRQDPDVVMVGEIRDLETAQIAVQASLTGHLVLSTLHTNSALGAIARLRDMGVETFLLASSLIGLIAQRLVRRLCMDCKKAKFADAEELALLGLPVNSPNITIYNAAGCHSCNQTGYQGRCGIYELIILDDALTQMIHEQLGEQALEKYVRTNTPSMRSDGFQRVLDGTTTISEVVRVTSID